MEKLYSYKFLILAFGIVIAVSFFLGSYSICQADSISIGFEDSEGYNSGIIDSQALGKWNNWQGHEANAIVATSGNAYEGIKVLTNNGGDAYASYLMDSGNVQYFNIHFKIYVPSSEVNDDGANNLHIASNRDYSEAFDHLSFEVYNSGTSLKVKKLNRYTQEWYDLQELDFDRWYSFSWYVDGFNDYSNITIDGYSYIGNQTYTSGAGEIIDTLGIHWVNDFDIHFDLITTPDSESAFEIEWEIDEESQSFWDLFNSTSNLFNSAERTHCFLNTDCWFMVTYTEEAYGDKLYFIPNKENKKTKQYNIGSTTLAMNITDIDEFPELLKFGGYNEVGFRAPTIYGSEPYTTSTEWCLLLEDSEDGDMRKCNYTIYYDATSTYSGNEGETQLLDESLKGLNDAYQQFAKQFPINIFTTLKNTIEDALTYSHGTTSPDIPLLWNGERIGYFMSSTSITQFTDTPQHRIIYMVLQYIIYLSIVFVIILRIIKL